VAAAYDRLVSGIWLGKIPSEPQRSKTRHVNKPFLKQEEQKEEQFDFSLSLEKISNAMTSDLF